MNGEQAGAMNDSDAQLHYSKGGREMPGSYANRSALQDVLQDQMMSMTGSERHRLGMCCTRQVPRESATNTCLPALCTLGTQVWLVLIPHMSCETRVRKVIPPRILFGGDGSVVARRLARTVVVSSEASWLLSEAASDGINLVSDLLPVAESFHRLYADIRYALAPLLREIVAQICSQPRYEDIPYALARLLQSRNTCQRRGTMFSRGMSGADSPAIEGGALNAEQRGLSPDVASGRRKLGRYVADPTSFMLIACALGKATFRGPKVGGEARSGVSIRTGSRKNTPLIRLGRRLTVRLPNRKPWRVESTLWPGPAYSLPLEGRDRENVRWLDFQLPELLTLGREEDPFRHMSCCPRLTEAAKLRASPRWWGSEEFVAWLAGGPVLARIAKRRSPRPREVQVHVGSALQSSLPRRPLCSPTTSSRPWMRGLSGRSAMTSRFPTTFSKGFQHLVLMLALRGWNRCPTSSSSLQRSCWRRFGYNRPGAARRRGHATVLHDGLVA